MIPSANFMPPAGPAAVVPGDSLPAMTTPPLDVRARGTVSVLRFDHARLEKDLVFFPHIMAKLNFNISGILGKRLAELVEARQPPPEGLPPDRS